MGEGSIELLEKKNQIQVLLCMSECFKCRQSHVHTVVVYLNLHADCCSACILHVGLECLRVQRNALLPMSVHSVR